ncbi:MAG: DNA polymerase/3'-5' exonuclease PolX [Phycisphaerales bacterium JB039]
MGANDEIADRFARMGQMLEILGENRFRIIAYERAASAVRDLSADIRELAGDIRKLEQIEGIGDKMAAKIVQYVQTGRIKEYDDLAKKVPEGLLEILAIPGVGPKSVKLMWEKLGVTNLAGLKQHMDDGSLAQLPRMGAKTVENIRAALKFLATSSERTPLGLARPLAEAICARMTAIEGVEKVTYAGSLRRGRETIGDIDLLMVARDPAAAAEAFRSMPEVTGVLVAGETKSSVRMRARTDDRRLKGDGPEIQVDLRVVPAESWGAALLYFTGSKEHNVRLRERALKQHLTLNEYGLYPEDPSEKHEGPPQQRGVRAIAGAGEEEVYAKLGLPWIPPEIREARSELDLVETPELIEIGDIRAELHAHTTESDGHLKLEELVSGAKQRKFHTIAVTDHSQSSVQAGGLTVERLRRQRDAIDELRERTKGIQILHGSEVDILTDGRLDYNDDVLAELDIVVASPHIALRQDTRTATDRLIRAIENPHVRILGHPSGRLIGRREGLDLAIDEIIAAAKQHDVALEINANWLRLDLRDTHVRAAVEAGCLIAINCDVHAMADFDMLEYGVTTARRGWLPAKQCVNAWTKAKLIKWLGK